MAESLASFIAEKVLDKLGSLAYQEISLACGLKSELEELENTLKTIKAVLLDAEEQQANNHRVSVWLGKLKDVCYDVDDVLDEYEYEALWRQVVNRGGIKRKVCNFFSRSNPLAFRFKMGHKIKAIREKLDKIATEKAEFHLAQRVEVSRVVHMQQVTHSFVQASDVIGRDDDKENIIKHLMHTSDHENVSVIPIVGIGGLGKTTLAKLVYNDERVVRHFQLKMWVCVSEHFDVEKLVKEIIKSATNTTCGDLTIDQMQTCLREILRDNFFLLILDDVWNEDHVKWVELKNLLMTDANGSKIIVTTRSPLVASIMGTIPAYKLEGLPHKECMSLFVKWAFNEGEEKQHPNLLKIGDKIVQKCGGVPLAVRTLGSLLYLKTDYNYWLTVNDNELWEIEQNDNYILPALKLSYDAMPAHLKQCFAFCSIFPKDFLFVSTELIQLWMAHGFLQSSNENQELEDIGQQYIEDLWSKSFFQDFEDDEALVGLRFKMHDLVHDLASWVARTECFITNSRTHNISKRVQHMSFCEEDPRLFLEPNSNVRTILNLGREEGLTSKFFMETSIPRFNSLRVLDLSFSSFEVLPSSICKLKHLRYLNLQGNSSIKKLPNSVCKLLNLQTLVLDKCDELKELPKDIGNLTRLKVLYLTTKQMFLPDIGNSLRFLWIEGCGNLKSLGEGMQRLTALRTLLIGNCESLEESLTRSLKYLTSLQRLVICDCEKLNLMEWEEDVSGLRSNLRLLFIAYLPQLVALPPWLQGAANTLQFLRIERCGNLTALPEWLQNLTSLQKLEIKTCSKLSALPEGMRCLTTLRELKIEKCPKLMRRCKRETGKDWPKIALVPKITLDEITSDEEETCESSYSVSC